MSVASDYQVEEVVIDPIFKHQNYLECIPQRHVAHYVLLATVLISQVNYFGILLC